MSEQRTTPPSWALHFLERICPDHLFEEIEGDLIQRFNKDERNFGEQIARRRFLWNAVRFLRPGIILRNKFRIQLTKSDMIRNYLLVAFRNFRKQKSFTFLNITGLTLGMVASLLILQYVKYERSFDKFHSKAEDIYRIQYSGYQNEKLRFE